MKPALKKMRSSMIMSCLLAGACLGATGSARADAFAQAILTIDNLRMLNSSGIAYVARDFNSVKGTNDGYASATLDNQGSFAPAQSFGVMDARKPDIAHRFVGLPNPPRAENDFTPFASPSPVPGTFGYADQYMRGSLIGGGARMQTRADASLAQDGWAAGSSNTGTITSFDFMLNAADSVCFAFDATPFTQAYTTGNPETSAKANVTWNMSLRDQAGNEMLNPADLNKLHTWINDPSIIGHTHDAPGLTTYAPGTLALTLSTSMLSANTKYRLTINQASFASATQDTPVPEPTSLAIFGLGLLGMTMLRRRG